jgi:hypothetical protein
MTRISKIEKHGLRDKFESLVEAGFNDYQIRDKLRKDYIDNPDIKNISVMAINRERDKLDTKKIEHIIETSDNPIATITKEVEKDINNAIKELKYWSTEAKSLYERTKQDGTYRDQTAALKTNMDNLNNRVRALESKLHNFGRAINKTENIKEKKEQNLNIMLLELGNSLNSLCPECKKKALIEIKSKIMEITEDNRM